jgi:hypothetical protein
MKTLVTTVEIGINPESNKGVKWFHETAERHGIQIEVFRDAPRKNNWIMKGRSFFEWIRKFEGYDSVIMADAKDTLWATDIHEMQHHFKAIGHPFVMSAEVRCYPFRKLADRHLNIGRWRYPNAGFWMATWEAFLKQTELLLRVPLSGEYFKPGYDGDQGHWQAGILQGLLDVTLDAETRLSLPLNGCDKRWTDMNKDISWGKRPRNKVTGFYPCTLHANGGSKWRLKDAAEMLLA